MAVVELTNYNFMLANWLRAIKQTWCWQSESLLKQVVFIGLSVSTTAPEVDSNIQISSFQRNCVIASVGVWSIKIWFYQTSWYRSNYHDGRFGKLTFQVLALHPLRQRANTQNISFSNLSQWWFDLYQLLW